MMKFLRSAIAAACLIVSGQALAQTETFSTYVTGLGSVSTINGTERMFALQAGTPGTITPYQILAKLGSDCTVAAPPSIICLKTNGVAFSASATTDTTNASNISTGTLPLGRLSLANGSIFIGNVSNIPAAAVVSGDCTITNTGVITCPKVNGVPFVASATTDTTNASNISSGTLASARQSAANLAAAGNGGVTGILPYANMPTGSLDTVLGYFGSTTVNGTALPNCTSGSLQYSTTTHLWTCSASAGSGNVSNSGSPTALQIAQWVTVTTIKGVPVSALPLVAAVKVQPFTAGGTYTPSAGLQYAIIECQAGGGGGGGVSDPSPNAVGAGGGGAGGYSQAIASAATIGASQVVTVGNGGAGGAAGSNNGGAGGASSVGSLCTANGGSGGGGASVGNSSGVSGGAGGTAGTGNIVAVPGAVGGWGGYGNGATNTISGSGANSFYGAGGGPSGVSGISATNGLVASGFGAGGGGAVSSSIGGGAGAAAGGNATSGKVIITEFTNQ